MAKGASRPNILWITFEDTSPQFIGCYGAAVARTPTLDALADNGVRFDRAYSVGTVCAPSRSTLVTGCPSYQLGTGHHRSAYPIPTWIRGFPTYLREAGYYTSNNVKTDYNTSEHDRLVAESWDDCADTAGWWGRKDEQPFFSVFNLMSSHQKWTMTLPYEDYERHILATLPEDQRVLPEEVSLPPFLRDSPQMRRQFSRIHNSLAVTDRAIKQILDRLAADGLASDTIVFAFADHGEAMPRGKTNGIGLGYRVPMVVHVPPRWSELAEWPLPGTVTDELVTFEDLAPTVLGLAGVPAPPHLTGRVLTGPSRQEAPDWVFGASDRADDSTDCERTVMSGDFVYTRRFMPFQPELRWMEYHDISEIRVLMRADLESGRLSPQESQPFQPRKPEALYDIAADPFEMDNLIGNAAVAAIESELRAALASHLLAARDVMLLPEFELAQISTVSTPYEAGLDRAAYWPRLVEAAMWSGRLDDEALAAQLRLLESEDGPIRYWAVVGLRSHGPDRLAQARGRVLALLEDPYPPVRVLAAGLAHVWWDDEDASTVLEAAAAGEHSVIALLALEQLHLSPRLERFSHVVDRASARHGEHSGICAVAAMLRYRMGRAPLPVRRFVGSDRGKSPANV